MEVAAIIAGLLTIAAAFLSGIPAKLRVVSLIIGTCSAIYGVYVLNQSSGVWYFSVNLYLMPVILVVASIKQRRTGAAGQRYLSLASGGNGKGSPGVGVGSTSVAGEFGRDHFRADQDSATRRRSLLLLHHP
jgi:hypothetical protein